MTINSRNPNISADAGSEDLSHLDADLRSLVAGLDALGMTDRAVGGTGLEDRVVLASLASLHGVQPIAAQVAELGALDKAAASDRLEEGVFAESITALREGARPIAPTLRHIGRSERAERAHVRVVRRVWWSNQYARLAAAVVLAAVAAIGVRTALTPGTATPIASNGGLTKDPLARVNGEMELLFAAMESKPSTTDSTDSASDSDSDDLTKWLIEGSAS